MSACYVCCVCLTTIGDPLVYECDSRHFHKHCLKCQMCCAAIRADDKLYSINGLLVCRDDYLSLRSVCHVCRQRIDANDYRFETQNKLSIHMKCMSCQSCHSLLTRGDKYVIAEQRLLCHKCHSFAPQTPPPTTSRRGRKRANNSQ